MSIEKCVSYTDVIIMDYGNEHIYQQVRKYNWAKNEPFSKYVSNVYNIPVQVYGYNTI